MYNHNLHTYIQNLIFLNVNTIMIFYICIFLLRIMRWEGHVARMGEGRGVYRVLVGKPEGKKPLGRHRRRWEDNIKADLQEVGCEGVDWIELAQDRDRWRALVNVVMKLWAAQNAGNLLTIAANRLTSQEGLWSMQ
jgi:hypothetical protein